MSLEKLQSLRQRRMEQRFVELQTQRHTLEQRQLDLNNKASQLNEFQRFRLQQQEVMFAHLQSKPFATTSWHDYQKILEQLRLQEEFLHQELQNTRKELELAESRVEQARQKSREANLKLEKMKEIIKQDASRPLSEPAQ